MTGTQDPIARYRAVQAARALCRLAVITFADENAITPSHLCQRIATLSLLQGDATASRIRRQVTAEQRDMFWSALQEAVNYGMVTITDGERSPDARPSLELLATYKRLAEAASAVSDSKALENLSDHQGWSSRFEDAP